MGLIVREGYADVKRGWFFFLPSGDAALTRRAGKYSKLTAVVLKWSRARKRYERQGLLVEEAALERAEKECLDDAETRARRRERETEQSAELDREYAQRFAARVRELFPACPAGREQEIAENACLKYTGRVGRSAAAKNLDNHAILLQSSSTSATRKRITMNYSRGDGIAGLLGMKLKTGLM